VKIVRANGQGAGRHNAVWVADGHLVAIVAGHIIVVGQQEHSLRFAALE